MLHNKRMAALSALSVVVMLCLGGCFGAESGQKSITDTSKVDQIQKGVSTKSDIANAFGDPQGRDFLENGDEQWTYAYEKVSVDPKTYIPFAGMFVGGSTSSSSVLTVTFDKKGVVKAYGVSNSSAEAGHGKM